MPLSVSASAVPRVNPLRSSAAPVAATMVPAPVVPNGVLVALPAAPSFTVPTLMVVKPLKPLVPESVRVPAPDFASVVEPFKFAETIASPVALLAV